MERHDAWKWGALVVLTTPTDLDRAKTPVMQVLGLG